MSPFRTVMAYNCPGGCPRVLHWSNPDMEYGGQPLGRSRRRSRGGRQSENPEQHRALRGDLPHFLFRRRALREFHRRPGHRTRTSSSDLHQYLHRRHQLLRVGFRRRRHEHGGKSRARLPAGRHVYGIPHGGRIRRIRTRVIEYDYITVYKLHDADTEAPAWSMDGNEVNRVLSYWRAGGYHCDASGLDGFRCRIGRHVLRSSLRRLPGAGLGSGRPGNRPGPRLLAGRRVSPG